MEKETLTLDRPDRFSKPYITVVFLTCFEIVFKFPYFMYFKRFYVN